MKVRSALILLCVGIFLEGCAATRARYNGVEMQKIKTIAVEVPAPTHFTAVSVGISGAIPIPGANLAAAAVTGVMNGAINAAGTRKNLTFNDLVVQKLGTQNLNREFVDQLEKVLRDQGYKIEEISTDTPGVPQPKLRYEGTTVVDLEGGAFPGADAIMVIKINTGYAAAGLIYPYTRSVTASVTLFQADSLKPIYRDYFAVQSISNDAYSYPRYADLVADIPHAIDGVRAAVFGLVPEFQADLSASRGIASSTAAAKDVGADLH